jgi:hypothetical protein
MTMSRKKHDTAPVTAAAALAHDLLGEEKDKPVSETRADWIEVLADTPAPDSHDIFSPAVGNLVCDRIANGESLLKISSEPAMPSRSTMHRWCRDKPEFREEYQIAVQLRADGLLEETIEIIDDKKEIVTETTTEDEDGTKRHFRQIDPLPKEAVPRPSKVRLMGLSIECSPNPRLRLNDGLYLTPGLRPTPLRPLRSRSIKSLSSWPRRLGAALRLISSSNFTRFGSNIGPPVWAAEQISECLSKSPTAGHVAHHGDPFVECDP